MEIIFTPVNVGREIKIPKCGRNILGASTGLAFQTPTGVEVYIDYCLEEDDSRMLLYTFKKNSESASVESCAGMDGSKPCIFYNRGKEK